MIPFIRLIRIKNLAVITISMIGVAYFLHLKNPYEVIDFNSFHYGLLIASTLLIAAAGHVINDYFDLKADRINKPQSIVLSRHISKRWAILVNWIFNGLAIAVAAYLSWYYQNLVFVVVHLISINLLWFYSAYWKRKLLLGNVVLAALPCLVLFLSSWFMQVLNESVLPFSPYHANTWSTYLDYRFIYFVGICAFFIILSKEIIKDIKDIPGDTIIDANTIPRKIGLNKAQLLSLLILQLPGLLFILLSLFTDFQLPSFYAKLSLGGLQILFILSMVTHWIAPKIILKTIHWIADLALLLGLSCLFF